MDWLINRLDTAEWRINKLGDRQEELFGMQQGEEKE